VNLKTNSSVVVPEGDGDAVGVLRHGAKIKKQVIPVIYIPGIFASRLEKTDGNKVWDPDDALFMLDKLTRGISFSKIFTFIRTITKSKAIWSDQEIETKVNLVTNKSVQLMNILGTPIKDKKDQESKSEQIEDDSKVFESILDQKKIDPTKYKSFGGGKASFKLSNRRKRKELQAKIKTLALELHKVRRDRGWYTILGEYFEIMETITLTDHDEFLFPTFGFGYDWRQDIKDSGDKLKNRIDEIIAIKEYPEYGELGKDYEIEPSNKVIIVTHSMGSIVTRHASEISGAKDKIHGVLHLNQPTTGAPVLYRRFLTGTEIEKVSFSIFSPIKSIGDNVFNEILGTTSYHFTKLVGSMPGPGPLELLPTNQHRVDNSLFDPNDTRSKNNWLDIKHRFLIPSRANNTLDVYEDVYKNERFGLLACKRYDDTGKLKPYTKEEFKLADLSDPWSDEYIETKPAEQVTDEERNDYTIEEYYPDTTPYEEDSYRLIDTLKVSAKEELKGEGFKYKLHKTIDTAKSFHDILKLKGHSNTTVSGSIGKNTVLKIDITLNKNNVLNLPYTLTTDGDGDGTVPRTSEIALLASPDIKEIELVKGGLIQGDIAHAEIPSNGTALKQVKQFLKDVTVKLSKQNAVP